MVVKLKVEIIDVDFQALPQLQQKWSELELKASNSIFTSWHWINTWLQFVEYKTQLLTVTYHGKIVGLAFVIHNSQSKYGIQANQLWLNRTGNTSFDQIWNEYNDILCEKGLEYSIRSAVLEYFEKNLATIDEFIIGVSNKKISETPFSNKLMQYTSWKTTSYSTNLTAEYAKWSEYLQSLSKNTRNQIKRSAKLFGGIENISLTPAKTTHQAIEYFNAAGKFHKLRWVDQNSGFQNEHFINFHQQFIENNFTSGYIDIIKIHIKDKTICYLYNLIYKDTVYFYLSGIEYGYDNRFKPGLLSHSLATSHYAKLGYKKYDFMGGEGRYKNSLSDNKSEMIISNFRRKTLPFITSHFLRQAKSSALKLAKRFD